MFTTSAEMTELELVVLPVALSDEPGTDDKDEDEEDEDEDADFSEDLDEDDEDKDEEDAAE